jgi:hypothetical protein
MFAGNWRPADFVPRCWWAEGMSWCVALIDSCGIWPGVIEAAAFATEGGRVEQRATVTDPSGHGSRIAQLFLDTEAGCELLLGQVFVDAGATTSAAVAAAVDWAVGRRAKLIHLSLGLAADRAVLAAAVAHAIGSGCIIVASAPARGAPVYPAAYPGVIRGTGDARCAPGELSCLDPWFFGGCPRLPGIGQIDLGGGASAGAAWVTRNILKGPTDVTARDVVAALIADACYIGLERRGPVPAS